MTSHRILALVCDVWPEIRAALSAPWETPKAIAHAVFIRLRTSRLWEEIKFDIAVAGAPDQHILCLKGDEQLILCSPGMILTSHPFVRELVDELEVDFEEHSLSMAGDCLIAPLTETLKTRLTLPSVLLVSLFHPEMYSLLAYFHPLHRACFYPPLLCYNAGNGNLF
ncbi:MAG TPA: hypothetical protein VKV20_07170 [Ktedonobacteraceae bacterium]|jgi:hypothetical protein|nr:hypothetical protein [Ktedonobacteraceae bacterium]